MKNPFFNKSSTSFFPTSLRRLKALGSVTPSSRYLARRMVRGMDDSESRTVVELGAGSGIFTTEILRKIPREGKVLAFENDEALASALSENIQDPRLQVICDDAENIAEYVSNVDFVVSGLPLGNMSAEKQFGILESIRECLAPDGRYIQFQYFLASAAKIKKVFPKMRIAAYELRNFPPAFVYECARN